ncbi:autophagy- protein 2 [Phlyctochytrium bullatum]|nr:autophagy- protein 2 [Phlyctochytrium bullatum]
MKALVSEVIDIMLEEVFDQSATPFDEPNTIDESRAEDYSNSFDTDDCILIGINPKEHSRPRQRREFPFRFSVKRFDFVWKLYDGGDWPCSGCAEGSDFRAENEESLPVANSSPTRSDAPFNSDSGEDYDHALEEEDRNYLSSEERRASGKKPSNGRPSNPSLEVRAFGIRADIKVYSLDSDRSLKLSILIKDFDIIDHIKSSTWRKFLSHMRPDNDSQPREKKSDMIRVDLLKVKPNPSQPLAEETRLKVQLLPIRLHVDQDALTCLIKFFSFSLPGGQVADEQPPSEPLFFRKDLVTTHFESLPSLFGVLYLD